MATPLDLGLLQNVGAIFPFLLVLVLSYAVMAKTNIFGDNKGVYMFVAFVLAIVTLFSPLAVSAINRMAPWFVLLLVFSVFLLLSFQAFGVESKTITSIITGKEYGNTFFYWVITIVLLIAIGSITSVVSEHKGFGALSGENSTTESSGATPGNEQVGFFQTIFHPKVLGMALLLLIAMFTVRNLASQES
jgi:hypothetical protein